MVDAGGGVEIRNRVFAIACGKDKGIALRAADEARPSSVSFPARPFKILMPELPVMMLAPVLPVPLMAAVPVRVRFSILAESVKVAED